MKTIEVTGKTLDEAKMNALIELQASSDQVTFEVLDEGSKGLLGLFGKSAKVRATLREEGDEPVKEESSAPVKKEASNVSFAGKAEKKTEKAPVKESKRESRESRREERKPDVTAVTEEDHLNDEIRTFDAIEAVTVTGETVKIDDTIEQRLKKANENKKKNPEKRERRERNDREYAPRHRYEDREEEAEHETKPAFEPKVYEIPVDSEEVIARTKEFLTEVLSKMGIDTTVTAAFSEDGILEVNIEGDGMGIIIGKRGQTLDSLQYLATLVINKGRQDHVRMKLDTEGYRARRQETLEKLAVNLAKKAKRTGHKVVLEPMNPYERRIIHSVLQADHGVETHSDGEEPYRKVVITPKRRR